MVLIKPKRLNRGDRVAAVSLSWGGAGDRDILWRYEVGKRRLTEEFGPLLVNGKGRSYFFKPQKISQVPST